MFKKGILTFVFFVWALPLWAQDLPIQYVNESGRIEKTVLTSEFLFLAILENDIRYFHFFEPGFRRIIHSIGVERENGIPTELVLDGKARFSLRHIHDQVEKHRKRLDRLDQEMRAESLLPLVEDSIQDIFQFLENEIPLAQLRKEHLEYFQLQERRRSIRMEWTLRSLAHFVDFISAAAVIGAALTPIPVYPTVKLVTKPLAKRSLRLHEMADQYRKIRFSEFHPKLHIPIGMRTYQGVEYIEQKVILMFKKANLYRLALGHKLRCSSIFKYFK